MINSLETRKQMCSLTCIFICTCLQHRSIVRKANLQRLNLDGFQLIRPYGARKDFHSTLDKTPRRPPRRIDRGTTEMNFHSLIGRCFVCKRATSTSPIDEFATFSKPSRCTSHGVSRDFHIRMFTRRDVKHCFLHGLHSSENPLFPADSFAHVCEIEANASWH